jgi:hypothetical protein
MPGIFSLVRHIFPFPKKDLQLTSVKFYDGDKLLGEATTAPWEIEWKHESIGCRTIWAEYTVNGRPAASNPAMICYEPN